MVHLTNVLFDVAGETKFDLTEVEQLALSLLNYRGRLKGFGQVARMLQASSGRSDKQQQ